jgi:broad specificity phosphatase PhoE
MTRVVLIRPGATLYDEQKRIQGILDIPLCERGRTEIAAMAGELKSSVNGQGMSALYHGPGESCQATADLVAKLFGIRPKKVEELRNLDCGLWQGLQLDDVKRRNVRVFRQWHEEPETICPPSGESFGQASERVRSSLPPLVRRHKGEVFGIVVGEPLARIVSAFLRREAKLHLDDPLPTGRFDIILLPADWDPSAEGPPVRTK